MRWTRGIRAFVAFSTLVLSGGTWAQQAAQDEAREQIAKIAPARCAEPVAKIASIQGLVELRGRTLPNWQRAQLNDSLCLNDSIRVGPNSRASFQYAADIAVQLDQNTFVTLIEPKDQLSVWTQLWRGALHFITRSRKPYRVITPFANGSVEGTEVDVALKADRADFTVFEGKLDVANDAGQVLLESGESASVQGLEAITGDDQFRTLRAEAPRKVLIAKPRDAVQWALYYPPVIDARPGENVHPNLKAASEQFRAGNTADAFAELERVPAAAQDAQYLIYRASLKLYVGREQEAQTALTQALQQNAKQSDALALQAIIAVVQSDKEQGLSLAQKAVDADPTSAAAHIALSYAQQAVFKLESALASAEQAAQLDPGNALAYARIAELQLSQGDLDKALTAAKKATELNPKLARTQSILGFSYLTRIDTKNAKETFAQAIQLDSSDPLPHLGLGLAKIREGKLAEGRQDIEQAVILDPNNSLIRSYVGKAYYEEKRDELAGKQFEIAKELDPRDPTPWFYDAIRKQTQNRPVEALRDLQVSIENNDNRAPFRSRLLLDQDDATRSANAARTYTDLGFSGLALAAGTQAVTSDPTSYSAHRFLADAYLTRPRHEIARVSELLQAQLLQPVSVTPLQPQLSESSLNIVEYAAPTSASYNEFGQLMNRDRISVQGRLLAGNNSTFSDDLVLSGFRGRFGLSLGQFHYETDGFRENNDQKHDIYGALLQYAASPRASVSLELRRSERRAGDIELKFDPLNTDEPANFDTLKRSHVRSELARLGLRFDPAPSSTMIAALTLQDFTSSDVTDLSPFLFEIGNQIDGKQLELGYSKRSSRFNLAAGLGAFRSNQSQSFLFVEDPTDPSPPSVTPSDIDHRNGYAYAFFPNLRGVGLTLGLSADSFEQEGKKTRRQINPKLGLTWEIDRSTTMRAAAFRTLKRVVASNQTIEPTQIAGFNQFFDDRNGTDARRHGLAFDRKISDTAFAGIEIARRTLRTPATEIDPESEETIAIVLRDKERFGRVYAHFAPKSWLALSIEYSNEKIERAGDSPIGGFSELITQELPVHLKLIHSPRLSSRASLVFVRQKGLFVDRNADGFVLLRGSERFSVLNLEAEYAFPKRYGTLTLGVHNLLGEKFNFQDIDPVRPRFQPERLVFGRLAIAF